jgi:hypothetical protein
MRQYLRIAGYMFLALCGLTAWLQIEAGWRHYLGFILFCGASFRIVILLKQQRAPSAQKDSQPSHRSDNRKEHTGQGHQTD